MIPEVLRDWFVHYMAWPLYRLCVLSGSNFRATTIPRKQASKLLRFLAKTFDMASNSANASQNLNAT